MRGDRELVSPLLRTAVHYPDRLAVVAPDGTASYGELVAHAVALAKQFHNRGVGPDDRVGVVLDPGRDAIAAVLATLLLGAAYVPIDPGQPAARIAAMLTGCSAPLFVTASGDRLGMDEEVRAPAWLADLVEADTTADADTAPNVVADGSNVAYVVHTSGSTGRPKAIEVEHLGVVNLVTDLDRRAPVSDGYRGSWWTSPSFDVSVWELWAPLSRGGTVVVVPDEDRLEGDRFAVFLDRAQIQSAYVPPAFLPDLRDHLRGTPTASRSLRRMLVGVEPIPLGLLQDIMTLRPGLNIVNGYGPAETTVCATLYPVPRHGGSPNERTPIGTAVTGNRLYILDGAGRPADTGELVIAGTGVARGYLRAPAGSDSPFFRETGAPHQRAYRTGDFVRRLPDGNLIFEGRVDRQMKVRGYRIEPGEVEAALRAVCPLRDVVVGARDLPEAGSVVAAYLVMEAGHPFDRTTVLARLRRMLPLHAVPGVLLELDQLPLTPHGKIDHIALATLPVSAGGQESPVCQSEEPGELSIGLLHEVLTAWRAALSGRECLPDSAFVELGGTSIAAARAAASLRLATGREVSAAQILRAGCARDLATAIARTAPITPPAVPRQRLMTGPLTIQQAGLWLHEHIDPRPNRYVENVCFDIYGSLDVERLATAVANAIAARPAFGAVIQERDGLPEWTLGRCTISPDLRRVRGTSAPNDLDQMLASELDLPFDLTHGPLMRSVLIRVGSDHHVMILTWHHLVVDGWSARAFLADVEQGYADTAWRPPLAEMTICDLAVEEATRAREPAFRTQVDTLASALRTIPLTVTWPGSSQPAPHDTFGESVPLQVPPELVRQAELAAAGQSVTFQALTAAAYQRAVERTTGVDRFLLGCAAAGRTWPGSEMVAGYLVNTVLVAGGGLLQMEPSEAIHAAAEGVAYAISREDVPFPVIADELLRDSRPRPLSFPEVYFSFDEEIAFNLAGLDCRRRRQPTPQVKLHLALSLEYGPGRLSGVLQSQHSALGSTEARSLLAAFLHEIGVLAASLGPPASSETPIVRGLR